MPLLTDKQKQDIRSAIRDHHLSFQVEMLGEGSVTKEDLRRLRSKGLLKAPTPKSVATMATAHSLGTVAATVGDKELKKVSPEGFWDYVTQSPPKLTTLERAAIKATQDNVGRLITGLGDKVLGTFDGALHAEDQKLRRDYLNVVQEEVATGIAKREGLKSIASTLRKATGDSSRDWDRTVHTEVNNAIEDGKAHTIASRALGKDPWVFKRPRPDACRFCVLLYLNGKKPRVFKLSELSGNGTNYGRKAKRPTLTGQHATEWRAVVGSMHPWCACSLHHLPEGFAFDDKGDMVFVGLAKAMRSEMTSDLAKLVTHLCEAR